MYHTIYFILFLINLSIWLFDCPELWTMWTLVVWRSIIFVFPLDRQRWWTGGVVTEEPHLSLVSGVWCGMDCCCSRGDLVPPSAGDHRHRVTATSVINPDHQLPPPWLLDDALDSRGQSIRVNKIKFFFTNEEQQRQRHSRHTKLSYSVSWCHVCIHSILFIFKIQNSYFLLPAILPVHIWQKLGSQVEQGRGAGRGVS